MAIDHNMGVRSLRSPFPKLLAWLHSHVGHARRWRRKQLSANILRAGLLLGFHVCDWYVIHQKTMGNCESTNSRNDGKCDASLPTSLPTLY